MKLSTKGRYGLRALLDLALHQDEGPVLLKDIARRQEFSLPYLQHLIAPLIAVGVVKSTRGAGGGVSLVKPPSEIKLSEVVQPLEGCIAPVDCVNNSALCHRSTSCVTRDIWAEMKDAMSQVLDSTTLQDLVERQERKGHPKQIKEREIPSKGSRHR
jgi:Rrf2 family cysteine metabolism transcriptional repressor